jgi:hypothetical protein
MRTPPHMVPCFEMVLPISPISVLQFHDGGEIDPAGKLDCFINGSQLGERQRIDCPIDQWQQSGHHIQRDAGGVHVWFSGHVRNGHTLMRFTINQRNTR